MPTTLILARLFQKSSQRSLALIGVSHPVSLLRTVLEQDKNSADNAELEMVYLLTAKPWLRPPSRRKTRNFLAFAFSLTFLGLFPVLKYLYHTYIDFIDWVTYDPLWSHTYVNASATTFPPHDPTYILFEPPMYPLFPAYAHQPVQKVRRLLPHCRDDYFTKGEPCHASHDPPLDVVWTWVNGSDRLFRESLSQAVRTTNPNTVSKSRFSTHFFRDHDELRHSIRSVLKHFSGSTTQLYIVTSDFNLPIPVMNRDEGINGTRRLSFGTRRLGLVPRWLDPEGASEWRDGDVHLGIKYHSEIFRANSSSSFNSYGIESQLMNLQGVSDNFVYMNDDFYMLSNLVASDFYTSSYGVVLRMQPDLLVRSNHDPSAYIGGEWGPLEYTNWCLSNRFGSRDRPYITHIAKSVSLSLLKEFSKMWDAEFAVTASHSFRGMNEGHRDIYSLFLFSHSLVERWREGLLWSWAVGKLGGVHDEWHSDLAWRDIGGQPGESVIEVMMSIRNTLDEDFVSSNLRAAGHVKGGKTRYVFSSGDGYPYDYRNSVGALTWPIFNSSEQLLCKIHYKECFDKARMQSASEFFKHIAFENIQCGDCIIHSLRAASGTSGLAAFLPDPTRTFYPEVDGRDTSNENVGTSTPHLPLGSDWRQGNFSLQSVIQSDSTVNIREWTLEMLERYRFVIGQTPTLFHIITSMSDARLGFKMINEDKDAALLCLNDNIIGVPYSTDELLFKWQEERWGFKAEWER